MFFHIQLLAVTTFAWQNLEILATRQRAEGTFHIYNGREGSLGLWVYMARRQS